MAHALWGRVMGLEVASALLLSLGWGLAALADDLLFLAPQEMGSE